MRLREFAQGEFSRLPPPCCLAALAMLAPVAIS